MMVAKTLILENGNNCLQNDVFIQINVALTKDRLPHYEKISDQLFVVPFEGESIYVRLIDIWFLKFNEIQDFYTLWACGQFSKNWREQYLEKHPETTCDSPMAIYCYQREKM